VRSAILAASNQAVVQVLGVPGVGGGGSGTSEKPILGALGLRRFSLHLVTLPPNCFAHNLWLYIAIKQLWLASD